MMRMAFRLKQLSYTWLLIIVFNVSFAQDDVTTYYMRSVPQSSYANPAFMPDNRLFIGMPALSSLYFSVGNSGFSFNDVAVIRDTLLYLKPENLLTKLRNKNHVYFDFKEDLVSFGFRKKKNYFMFNAATKLNYKFGYPRDLFALIIKGNGAYLNKTLFLDGLGMDFIHYNEYAASFARKIDPQLTIGTRVKYIQGLSNIYSRKSDISLFTAVDSFDLSMTSNLIINTSVPAEVFLYDSISYYNDFDPKYRHDAKEKPKTEDQIAYVAQYYLANQKNKGFGIDIGANYIFSPRFSASASIVDLGYIFWKNHTQTFRNQINTFTFDGVDAVALFGQNDSMRKAEMQKALDTLYKKFSIVKDNDHYITPLSTKLYIGGLYRHKPTVTFGALFRGEFFRKSFYPSLTLSYNQKFNNFFSLSTTYTISRVAYYNVGLGFSTSAGPFQLYLVNDNIMAYLLPLNTKNYDLRFGINWVFGRKVKKHTPSVRRPLIGTGGGGYIK